MAARLEFNGLVYGRCSAHFYDVQLGRGLAQPKKGIARTSSLHAREEVFDTNAMPGLPLKRWGKVVTSPKLSASAVRIEPAGEGSYLLLFREAHGEFDEWFESMADLERALEGSSIDWEADSGPER